MVGWWVGWGGVKSSLVKPRLALTKGTKTDDFDAQTRLPPTKGTKTDDFDAKTRLAPTKGTQTDDFDAKTRLIFMIYLMYWI